MAVSIAERTSNTPQQHWFSLASVYLHDQLRAVFDACEEELLQDGEQTVFCCELRRARRSFVDNYLNQLWLRCQNPTEVWVIGGSSAAPRARTLIYLTDADRAVRALYQDQAVRIGNLVAAWRQQTGIVNSVFDCPFAPHILTRLFFLLLPEIHLPLRVRCKLASKFIEDLPRFSMTLQDAVFSALQRRGVSDTALEPVAMPEWWEVLEKMRQPSATALALIAPPRSVERVSALAQQIAVAALDNDVATVQTLLASQRSTTLFSWLSERIADANGQTPPLGKEVLCLLAGPLLQAACEESFVDFAHPARKVLLEWSHWAPGWQDSVGIDGVVPEFCRELSTTLAKQLAQGATSLLQEWLQLQDYLQQLRYRVQQDMTTAVASTRLSLQVLEVRSEVEALIATRANSEFWPPVVIEILHDYWLSLLLSIHWREGTASDNWLSALAVVDDLLASVQPAQDRQARIRAMQHIPVLLQELRKGFDQLGCDRQTYSALLDRLQAVHLAVAKDEASSLTEKFIRWPAAASKPAQGDPFEVGTWLRGEDGRVLAVEFSDRWCTALRDAHDASLECHSTAVLQAAFYEGNLEVLPVPAYLQLLAS